MDNDKTVELFAGTGSFSKVANLLGYDTFTVEYDASFNPDFVHDLRKPLASEIQEKMKRAFFIWMSPPCNKLTLASGNRYWTKDRQPRNQEAVEAKQLLMFCKEIADRCIASEKYFIIENPMAGRATWFLPEEWRKKAWYCRYGDKRAKPTYFWTNIDWNPKVCFNGNKDCHHEPAPRGSKTGTQGLKGSKERAVIPPLLIKEIFSVVSNANLSQNNRKVY